MKNALHIILLLPLIAGIISASVADAAVSGQIACTLSTDAEGNVFSDKSPEIKVNFSNVNGKPLTGTGTFIVRDQIGKKVMEWTEKTKVVLAPYRHEIPLTRNGLFTLTASFIFSDGSKSNGTLTFAKIPDQKEPTLDQKMASPYGINVHGAHYLGLPGFKKAGIYLYRDYAFLLEWFKQAKGADGHYAGWINYPKLIGEYEKNGLLVVPIISAIEPPKGMDGKKAGPGPTSEWVNDFTDVLQTFPAIRYWELDNEYDLHFAKDEKPLGENYALYHKKFGELVSRDSGDKRIAVEEGRATVDPVDIERIVKTGSFDKIGAVNVHHYTGTEPPELNVYEYNTGDHTNEDLKGNFFDLLRATKKAGQADGKKRQAWLSEFGWDTKAGPIVSDKLQAAYLQRGFMMAFAAGIDKAFWFYNYDAETPKQFFDGCGLFTFDHQPKLSLVAMAGLTSILPHPTYVGSINAGPDTCGYVFENNGELIAGLWAIQKSGPRVAFHARELKDYLDNKISGLDANLEITPVYAMGLDKDDLFYRQTAYELDSPFLSQLMPGNSGEAVIVVTNNRTRQIESTVKINLPAEWKTPNREAKVTLAPGDRKELHFLYMIPQDAAPGLQNISFVCSEGKDLIKTIRSTVSIPLPYVLKISSILGTPGKTSVSASVTNRSESPLSGQLTVKLPSGWKTPSPTIEIENIAPKDTKITPVEITWNPDWKKEETATISFQSNRGPVLKKPVIPNQYSLQKAGKIVIDGKVNDWPAECQLPEWMLGTSVSDQSNVKAWLAWAPEGLYGAVEVHNSKGDVPDPKTFWRGDCLEIFLSTGKNEEPKIGPGDHHFWLAPFFQENRAYVGRWKIDNGIDATQYDLPGIKSAAHQTKEGYVMEFLLPGSVLEGYAPKAGGSLGINLNLTVHGLNENRSVYWPQNKDGTLLDNPSNWGRMILLR